MRPYSWSLFLAIVNSRFASAAPALAATRTPPAWSGSTSPTRSASSSTSTSPSSSQHPGACSNSGPVQTLSVSQTQPSSAVMVPGNYIGFGFETAFLNDYANEFSENLVDSVAQRLGATVVIRIGGTSGDRIRFNPNQAETKVCASGDCPVGSSATYILGPSYFEGFKSFPNQSFTFQAPLNPVVNVTNSLDYVTRAYAAAGADRVDAIAIGNEPDGYDPRSRTYTTQDYTVAALELESNITDALGLSQDDAIFEVLDTSSADNSRNFTVESALEDGLDKRNNVKYVAQHWYQSPSDLPEYGSAQLQNLLMNHSAISSKFTKGYTEALQYVESNYPSIAYILSETGSSLAGPPLEFLDAFGACLWRVDFDLYSMTLGVRRTDSTGRPAAGHSAWVPDTSANNASLGSEQNIGPQVRGPYYALPMLADFLGPSSGAVVEVLGEDTLTAYALYDNTSGDLSKVALVNMNFWSSNSSDSRGSATFEVPVGSSVSSVTIGRLQADSGAYALGYDAQGAEGQITWQGETWSYQLDLGKGSQVAGVATTETIAVCNGIAHVVLNDTSAAVVYIS